MVFYGPSPVTATAVALVKSVACKVLELPQSRVLNRPTSIATPNRISFHLTHPNLPLREEQSLVEVRQEIDKEVNRMIRADIPIEVHHNMTLEQLLGKFGEDVLDRFYDINEYKFADWLFNEYELITNKPIWNNWLEQRGPFIMRTQYQSVDAVPIDHKVALNQFLTEINGTEIDLLYKRQRKYFMRRRTWMRRTGQIPEDPKDLPEGASEFELVTGKRWTASFNLFERLTSTNFEDAHKELKFSAWSIEGVGCGLCLPNHYSRHWNSENIQTPIGYLRSTGELGKVVLFQCRHKSVQMRSLKLFVDAFPGYNPHIIGVNPYVMFRETFNIKHLASIIPDDHELPVPQMATPIDYASALVDTEQNTDQYHDDDDDDDDESVPLTFTTTTTTQAQM